MKNGHYRRGRAINLVLPKTWMDLVSQLAAATGLSKAACLREGLRLLARREGLDVRGILGREKTSGKYRNS